MHASFWSFEVFPGLLVPRCCFVFWVCEDPATVGGCKEAKRGERFLKGTGAGGPANRLRVGARRRTEDRESESGRPGGRASQTSSMILKSAPSPVRFEGISRPVTPQKEFPPDLKHPRCRNYHLQVLFPYAMSGNDLRQLFATPQRLSHFTRCSQKMHKL